MSNGIKCEKEEGITKKLIEQQTRKKERKKEYKCKRM